MSEKQHNIHIAPLVLGIATMHSFLLSLEPLRPVMNGVPVIGNGPFKRMFPLICFPLKIYNVFFSSVGRRAEASLDLADCVSVSRHCLEFPTQYPLVLQVPDALLVHFTGTRKGEHPRSTFLKVIADSSSAHKHGICTADFQKSWGHLLLRDFRQSCGSLMSPKNWKKIMVTL